MNRKHQVLITLSIIILTGCGNKAMFATHTSIGINLDTKTQTAALAYDRQEGYLGPTYGKGTPSVVASLQSDGKILSPQIMQAYATGDAAIIAVGGTHTSSSDNILQGEEKTAFFGTSTTTGFKFGFSPGTAVPDEVVLGFKRQELSYIPLISDGSDGSAKKYASTLAFYDMKRTASTAGEFSDKQYFATGAAAENLAKIPAIRQLFKDAAQEAALKRWDTISAQQQGIASIISSCYSDAPFQMIPSIWQAAIRIGLIQDSGFLSYANAKYEAASILELDDNQKKLSLFRLDGEIGPSEHYLAFIRDVNDEEARSELLITHTKTVCNTAQ